ncbi:MAG: hypothetical protein NTY19_19615, partial [Planctomycetota bacterium]|nr:hypothetical protein [Planctomycetota bacterium]
ASAPSGFFLRASVAPFRHSFARPRSGLHDHNPGYWFIEGDPQLSTLARTTVSDPANEVLTSPASYWEIAIKVSLGKWRLNRRYEDFLHIGLKQYGFLVLPFILFEGLTTRGSIMTVSQSDQSCSTNRT